MMTDENGILSIDFLAGFTIFMLAFIWVVSMIPGLLIGLQSYTIDYDAVAYRTGVILVEDPGDPYSPPWESYIDPQKSNVTRFGLALSKDTPNILSDDKVNRFFCTTAFVYPDDYRTRAIFGDYPYGFNISLLDAGGQKRSVGDVLPDGYGTIKRVVKIKGASNATINESYVQNLNWSDKYKPNPYNATTHVFSILIDNPKLLGDVTDPAYQIDPSREQITINITDLRSTITDFPTAVPPIDHNTSSITLRNIKVYKRVGNDYSNVPLPASDFPYIDGSNTREQTMPANVKDNITLKFSPQFFSLMKAQNSQIYIALGFTVIPDSTFLNNTQALPDYDTLDGKLTFSNPNTTPFNYDYNAANVTQPKLRDAVVEVSVWSGSVTRSGGSQTTPVNGSHTIIATAGSGGMVLPIGSVIVNNGDNRPFNITPNANFHIKDVVVDGVPNGAISSYTFTNVTEDHTIAASFAIDTYTITPTAGPNGAINPNTPQTVNYGSTPTFTFTPSGGHHVADVLVDGSSVGAVPSYTFPAVTVNHTINASFAVTTFTINATAGANGAINPSGTVPLNFGDTPTFTFVPDVGYHVADVLVDGSSIGAVPSYTFPAVVANHAISATFAINTYTITASSGGNGAVTPAGVTTVNYGSTPSYTITPNPGYHVLDVLVNGTSVGAVTSYIFPSVTTNKTISATFAANAPVSIFYDGFETVRPSSNSWTETSSVDWGVYTPRNGNNGVRLMNNEAITRTISTATYSGIIVQFAWAGQSLEAGEYVRAEYSTNGGTSWNTLSQLNGVIGAGVPGFTNFVSLTLPTSADHNANFQLRIRLSSDSHANDYAYIDDVQVMGIPD